MQEVNMLAKIRVVCLILLFTGGVASIADADQQTSETVNMQQMQQQLLELQKQMELMKAEHSAEIQSLKEQLQKATQTGTVTEKQTQQSELDALLDKMQEEAGEAEKEITPDETVFRFKGLGLQALNPEISASVDLLGSFIDQENVRQRTDFTVRAFELNFQSYLDPFSRFKATVPIDDAGNIEVEEAYFTRFNVLENCNLTLGKFRQQFGVINRWHGDALDQVNYPMPITMILGDDGLSQTGAALDWTMPAWGEAAQELNIQVTGTENERLFEGDTLGNPSILFHYKNFRDLSKDSYFEFGLSSLFGWNDEWQVGPDIYNDSLCTQVFGADFTYVWEPIERSMYRNIEWRSEILVFNRDILAPDGSGRDSLYGWGAFSYIHSKVDVNLYLGIRGDYFAPDEKPYASMNGSPVSPFAYASDNPYRWQVAPYITWWQSEFVRFHLEYNYANGQGMSEEPAHAVYFQVVFAAGPHKHERY
jgi:hypothetical protein